MEEQTNTSYGTIVILRHGSMMAWVFIWNKLNFFIYNCNLLYLPEYKIDFFSNSSSEKCGVTL